MFELYLMDLTPEKRKEFLEAHGCWGADVEDPSTFPNDWDIEPIMVFDTDDVDEFSFIVSVLDERNDPSDNLEAFVLMQDAIDYAKEHPGTGVFHERYRRDKEICEYELVWHPDAEVVDSRYDYAQYIEEEE